MLSVKNKPFMLSVIMLIVVAQFRVNIDNISLFSYLTNGINKLVCYIAECQK